MTTQNQNNHLLQIMESLSDIRNRLSIYETSYKFLSSSLDNHSDRVQSLERRIAEVNIELNDLKSTSALTRRLEKDFRAFEVSFSEQKDQLMARLSEINSAITVNKTVSGATAKLLWVAVGACTSGIIAFVLKKVLVS